MICDKKKCTGCFACFNICPKKAINMIEDDNGFIYPIIDEKKCVNCNLCKKICPSINNAEKHSNQKCYAVFSKSKEIREKSTSGGIATTMSLEIIKNGGVVYGAAYADNCKVRHIRVNRVEELNQLQGSKYVHSYIEETYKNVKQDLTNEEKNRVLFIGTPCQVAGLKKYLNKDYENLITIDIICHGVPSQKYLKDEVKRIYDDTNIDRVNFRSGNNYGFYIEKNKEYVYGIDIKKSPYCDSFMNGLSLRENCYNCQYANPERVSDITIGDFWGLSKESNFYDERGKGVSTVIISTKKGMDFFEENRNEFYIEERPYEESVNGNSQLRKPTIKNKNADRFKKIYASNGFYKTYKKCTKLLRLKRKVKRLLKR